VQTNIVAIPATHWADGGVIDLVVIGMAARAAGAKLVLDLTQSLGAMPFDIEAVQPDYMIAAGYKWLMGPYSLGYLYIAPQWQNGEPLEHNWMNRAGSEDFSRLVDYQDGFQKGARRFDMGEKSNPAQLMGSSEAIKQLLDWGVDNISETLGARNQALANRAQELGLTVPDVNFRSPHFLGLGFPDGMPPELPSQLVENNVSVSFRGDSMRVTQHLYNTDADVDRLFDCLAFWKLIARPMPFSMLGRVYEIFCTDNRPDTNYGPGLLETRAGNMLPIANKFNKKNFQ